MKVMMMWLLVL